MLAAWALPAMAEEAAIRVDVAVGRSVVLVQPDDVRTVSIADPRVADAAVGSERSVVVNGKEPGRTTLVVYIEGGKYRLYDVFAQRPNADRQVVLEVRVAEATKQAVTDLGFDWYGQGRLEDPTRVISGGLFPSKPETPTVLPLPFADPDFLPNVGSNTDGFLSFVNAADGLKLSAIWRALEEKGQLRTLAHPNLVARSGQQARFLAGGELPVPVAQTAGTGGTSISIEWKEYGVKVDFLPTVREDGALQLQVAPEVSTLDYSRPLVLSGYAVPSLITRRTNTSVLMQDGQSLVLGGLTQKDRTRTVKRVPVLGAIPLVGLLFSHVQVDEVERELLIVVTPKLVGELSTAVPPLPGQDSR
jgi:pilus assembly protein CpaC